MLMATQQPSFTHAIAERNDACSCGSGRLLKHCCLPTFLGPAHPPVAPGTMIDTARHEFEEGRLDSASSFLEQVLALDAKHPEALHYLGLIAYRRGDAL